MSAKNDVVVNESAGCGLTQSDICKATATAAVCGNGSGTADNMSKLEGGASSGSLASVGSSSATDAFAGNQLSISLKLNQDGGLNDLSYSNTETAASAVPFQAMHTGSMSDTILNYSNTETAASAVPSQAMHTGIISDNILDSSETNSRDESYVSDSSLKTVVDSTESSSHIGLPPKSESIDSSDVAKQFETFRLKSSAESLSSSCSSKTAKNKRRKDKQKSRKRNDKSSSVVKVEEKTENSVNVNEDTDNEVDSKRKRHPDHTPDSVEADSKKAKPSTPKKSFAETLTNALMVYIRFDNDEKIMTHECCDYVKNEISRVQYSFEQREKFVPRFVNTYFTASELRVHCVDTLSMNWLLQTAKSIPAFEQTQFVAYSYNTLPKLTNFTIFFFKKDHPNPIELLNRIQLSNPELQTRRWRILFGSQKEAGFVLGVGVDPVSHTHIEKLEMKPYFEMGRVNFQLLAPKSNKNGG